MSGAGLSGAGLGTPAGSYLEAWLAPLLPVLAEADVTDIFINRPGEIWVERLGGGVSVCPCPALDEARLAVLARQIAAVAHQGISRAHPVLAACLPDGARVQVVAPPATRGGHALAIRKHVASAMTLADYVAGGGFAGAQVQRGRAERPAFVPPVGGDGPELAAWLAGAVRGRANILISGGTSSGKTTLLSALMREIPAEERLILIEDTPELALGHANAVGLVAVRGDLGEARVGQDDLLRAALRMRPDRIILGELRGGEAESFLRAVNTGHPGSLTTIHADSPDGAIEQLALLALAGGSRLRRADIVEVAMSVIDLVVQVERRGGRRGIARIMATRGGA